VKNKTWLDKLEKYLKARGYKVKRQKYCLAVSDRGLMSLYKALKIREICKQYGATSIRVSTLYIGKRAKHQGKLDKV